MFSASVAKTKVEDADTNQGQTQVLLGCETLAEMEHQHVIWGVVAAFSHWIFIRRTGKRVELQTVGFDFGDEVQYFPIDQLVKIMRIFYQSHPCRCETTSSSKQQRSSSSRNDGIVAGRLSC